MQQDITRFYEFLTKLHFVVHIEYKNVRNQTKYREKAQIKKVFLKKRLKPWCFKDGFSLLISRSLFQDPHKFLSGNSLFSI